MKAGEQYCPICQRTIIANNLEEVASGEHDGYLYVHDDLPHAEDDIEALNRGIQ